MKSFFKLTGHVMCREMHNMYSYPDSVLNSSQLYTIKRGSSVFSGLRCTQGSSVKVNQTLRLKAQIGDVSLGGCAIWKLYPVWFCNIRGGTVPAEYQCITQRPIPLGQMD